MGKVFLVDALEVRMKYLSTKEVAKNEGLVKDMFNDFVTKKGSPE